MEVLHHPVEDRRSQFVYRQVKKQYTALVEQSLWAIPKQWFRETGRRLRTLDGGGQSADCCRRTRCRRCLHLPCLPPSLFGQWIHHWVWHWNYLDELACQLLPGWQVGRRCRKNWFVLWCCRECGVNSQRCRWSDSAYSLTRSRESQKVRL